MRLFCGLGLLVGAFVVCAENGVAQLNFGSIQGRITDATGAAIPGATVKLVFLNKNLSRQAASDPVGRFIIPSLEPGPYSLTVEVSGFKTQRREGLVLLTGQTLDIDGIDNTDYFQRNPIARPSVDAILEFAVQTSLPAAEFGPAGGAVISASTKSGTNEFRASVWEFLRNDVLDARSFFDGTKPI